MAGLFGGTPRVPAAVPPPQVDDAARRLNDADRAARRAGRQTTLLTGEFGLPDLGSTSFVQR